MASKKAVNSILCLRVVSLLVLAASVVLMATNNVKFNDADNSKLSFKDVHGYRYVVAVGGVGFVYTLIQLPFAIYHATTEKRWIKGGCMPYLDFIGDKVISWVLASGVGVGFGITVELQRFLKQIFSAGGIDNDTDSKTDKFLDRANIATGLLLAGVITPGLTSLFTSIKASSASPKGGLFR